MATLTTAKVASTVQPRANLGLNSVSATYTLTAALALNDVIQMVKIPAGATVIDVVLTAGDLDTNASPVIVLDVGDGTDVDRYIDGSTIAQAGGITNGRNVNTAPSAYSAEDTIDVLVQVGPATGAATGTIRLDVIYEMDV